MEEKKDVAAPQEVPIQKQAPEIDAAPAPDPSGQPRGQEDPPQSFAAGPPPVKTRWVGTITVALGLVAAGVLLLAWVFVPNLDMILVARLSPILLVFFGVELLIATVRHPGEKLRINFFTAFLSLVLIAGSLIAGTLPQSIQRHYESQQVAGRLRAELEDNSYQLLQNEKELSVSSVEWYVDLQDGTFSSDMTPMQIKTEQYVQVRVYMPGPYADADDFAAACRRAADVLQAQTSHIDYASFYSWKETEENRHSTDVRYSLWLSSRWQMEESAGQLAEDVYAEYWLPQENRYMDDWERQDRLDNPENYAAYDEPANEDEYDDSDYSADGDEDLAAA